MTGTSWRIGRLFGINIYIDSSWLLIFLLVTWTLAGGYFPMQYRAWPTWQYWLFGVITSLLFFLSVLIHEVGHSLVARAQGEKVDRITLFMFGGAAQIAEEPKNALHEFFMSVAGPLTSFLLAVGFTLIWLVVRRRPGPLAGMFYYLAIINAGLGAFNLIPGFPLDGGRVLRSIIWGITRKMRLATRIASWAGQTVAFLMVIFGVFSLFRGDWLNGLWVMSIGWFLRNAAISSYRQVVIREAMADVHARQLMNPDFISITPDLTISEMVEKYVIQRREHAYPVMDGEKLIGIICLHDIRRVPREAWGITKVGDVMTKAADLYIVQPSDDGNTILSRMAVKDVHQLPVLDGDKLVGIISRSDVVRFLQWQTEMAITI